MGNWCVKPESAIKPCSRKWGNVGPMAKDTTQKLSYDWKYQAPNQKIIPPGNIKCSEKPFVGKIKKSFFKTYLRERVKFVVSQN